LHETTLKGTAVSNKTFDELGEQKKSGTDWCREMKGKSSFRPEGLTLKGHLTPACDPAVSLKNPLARVGIREMLPRVCAHYQPIVSSHGHDVFAYEALARLPGLSAADAWIKDLEMSGGVIDVDLAMVERVSATCSALPMRAAVTINVSGITVKSAPDRYLAAIERLTRYQRVILEITETSPVDDHACVASFARGARRVGAMIALDDCTPAGATCTEALIDAVQPQMIKLDGQMVLAAHDARMSAPITELLRRARKVRAMVVAEHITTGRMRDWVASLGVSLMQGHYFGPAAHIAHQPGVAVGAC
jgi:EAL domain-containing protein (putative c-di-GMP-specific phosphodiesterase class I)